MSEDGSIDESLGNLLKVIFTNPIKGLQIKNNLKKYAKYKLDLAAIDMDSVKKKQAALKDGEKLTDREKEKFDTAEKAKKQAVKDKIDGVNARIGELATTDVLKKFSRMSKTKADLAAAQKLLKIAHGEEADALKLKINDFKEDITTATDELKDYAKKESGSEEDSTDAEKEAKDKAEKEAKDSTDAEKEAKDNTDAEKEAKDKAEKEAKDKAEKIEKAEAEVKEAKEKFDSVKDDEDEKSKLEAKLKFAQAQLALSKLKEDDDEKIQGFEDEIKEVKQDIEKLNSPETDPGANSDPGANNDVENKRKDPKEGFQLDTNNPIIKEAMKEANSLIRGGTGSPQDNIAKVNNTRDILRKAGLI